MEMQGPGRWELGNRGFHVGSFCLRHLLETHLEVASGWDIQRREFQVGDGDGTISVERSMKVLGTPVEGPHAFGALDI